MKRERELNIGETYFKVYTDRKHVKTVKSGILIENHGSHCEITGADVEALDELRAACSLMFILKEKGLLPILEKMIRMELT